MKVRSKRILAMLVACIMLCYTMALPVLAATSYFSGMTGPMNSFGTPSGRWPISSGSINANATVTNVTLNLTVSSGSSAYYLYVEDPDGNVYSKRMGTTTTQVSIPNFYGLYPGGTWYVWITSTGISTVSARMRVEYRY